MTLKRIAATVVSVGAISAGLVVVAGSASADDAITCYEAGFDSTPGVTVTLFPTPYVQIDDGSPYVRKSPSCAIE